MGGAPVFVFAYANDRIEDRRFLRNLPEERRRIRRALREASENGRCKLVELPNATVDELIDECQQHSDRIVLLHFSGHADGKTLLFENAHGEAAPAAAGALARFLGGLGELTLVFLNGCSTREQVDALLAADVKTVVATSTAVQDDVATEFAGRFYAAVAGGATIEDAFEQASGAVGMTGSGSTRAILRDVIVRHVESDGLPWEIHGSEEARGTQLLLRRPPPIWQLAIAVVAVAAVAAGIIAAMKDPAPNGGVDAGAVDGQAPDAAPAKKDVITGQVLDETGKPVEGAKVTGRNCDEVRTDANGNFELRGCDAVEIEIRRAVRDGGAYMTAQALPVRRPISGTYTLTKSAIRGQLLDVANNPIAGAKVTAPDCQDSTTADDKGRFELACETDEVQIQPDSRPTTKPVTLDVDKAVAGKFVLRKGIVVKAKCYFSVEKSALCSGGNDCCAPGGKAKCSSLSGRKMTRCTQVYDCSCSY